MSTLTPGTRVRTTRDETLVTMRCEGGTVVAGGTFKVSDRQERVIAAGTEGTVVDTCEVQGVSYTRVLFDEVGGPLPVTADLIESVTG